MRSASSQNFLQIRTAGLGLLAVLFGALPSWASPTVEGAGHFCVNYSASPDAAELQAFDTAILQPTASVDLAAWKAGGPGRKAYAYVSVGEVARHAAYVAEVENRRLKFLGENSQWGSRLVDITQTGWSDFVVDFLARPALDRGFDGLFLDTLDSIEPAAKSDSAQLAKCRESLVGLIHRLHETFPGKPIVVNRGFAVFEQIRADISGVLVESVFQTGDANGRSYRATAEADTQALKEKIAAVRRAGLPVYVVDYVAPADRDLAESTARRIRELDALPFVTTPRLNGECLAPLRRDKRRILVLFGSIQRESEEGEKFAADCFTAERLQTPLEWMGYEVEYLDIGRQSPPEQLDSRFAGIVFDAEMSLPYAGEPWYVDWVVAHRSRGLKVLFTGQYPFQQDVERQRLFRALGLTGTYQMVRGARDVEIAALDEKIMNAEAKVARHSGEIMDLRAPNGSDVALSVACKDERSNSVRYDTVYTSDWGGALLDPYMTFQSSAEDTLSLFEPFAFLGKIWPEGAFPAPDPSTRDGRRVFYSHIDGDGFTGVSGFDGRYLCGEMIRDRILKKYPLPVTCSVIEAEIRALCEDQQPADAPRFEEAARSVFALPNVQVGSHAFAHPYVWIDSDVEYIPLYESRMLDLQPRANYKTVDPEREIAGSIGYIQTLCPADKKCDIMLWSGNCRPGEKALSVCTRLGVENLNGGNTVISRKHPGIANVAPRMMQWGDEWQHNCSIQNDFVFTNNWSGPFFGGFTGVLEAFRRTEEPRRLKPVNVYYHFYSASQMGSLKALQRIYDWCVKEPLHSLTAREFCQTNRDSRETRIFRRADRSWRLVTGGHIRTFRLPKGRGVPDLTHSAGITGWNDYRDWMFVHTDGRKIVDLQLTDAPAPGLRLRDSMAEIDFSELSARRAHFRATDFRPDYRITFAGAAPGSKWKASINGAAPVEMLADGEGLLRFTLGGQSEVILTQES